MCPLFLRNVMKIVTADVKNNENMLLVIGTNFPYYTREFMVQRREEDQEKWRKRWREPSV